MNKIKDFVLTNLIPKEALNEFGKHFAKATGLSWGIVLAPSVECQKSIEQRFVTCMGDTPSKYDLPDKFNVSEIDMDRITPIFQHCDFCDLVRQSPIGNFRCWCSDLRNCRSAFQERTVVSYKCHMGLNDMVATIRVGGRHMANVYAGQVWTEIDEDTLKAQYNNLMISPLKELIRTFWYMYIKPTLSRAGALTHETDQYAQLIDTIVFMVKDWWLMEYKDIGFRDDKKPNRKVGYNANIILFSEKAGHQDFLDEILDQYQVSTLALGGQPSVLNVEYFVDDLKKQKIDIRRSFYLFSIVDYDPSGWIIRDAFVDDLRHYGVKHTQVIDLIHPDVLTPEEVKLARYRIPDTESTHAKNLSWLKEVHRRGYKNQQYLEEETKSGKKIIYGLESESVSGKRLTTALEELMVPLVGKTEDILKIFQLKKLNESIKQLIIHKLT